MGVLSNRVDLKAAAAIAERRARADGPSRWPPSGYRRNSGRPACSTKPGWPWCATRPTTPCAAAPPTPSAGPCCHRYDVATALAREVTDQALALAELATDTAGLTVDQPGPGARDATVEVVLAGTDPVPDTQVLARIPAGVEERTGTGADFGRLLGELQRRRLAHQRARRRRRDPPGTSGLEVVIVADASAAAVAPDGVGDGRGLGPGRRPPPRSPARPGRAPPGPTGRGPGDRGARLRVGALPPGRPGRRTPYRAVRPGWRTPWSGSTSIPTTAPSRSTAGRAGPPGRRWRRGRHLQPLPARRRHRGRAAGPGRAGADRDRDRSGPPCG